MVRELLLLDEVQQLTVGVQPRVRRDIFLDVNLREMFLERLVEIGNIVVHVRSGLMLDLQRNSTCGHSSWVDELHHDVLSTWHHRINIKLQLEISDIYVQFFVVNHCYLPDQEALRFRDILFQISVCQILHQTRPELNFFV